MLPNGRVYGRDRLVELEKKNLKMNTNRRDTTDVGKSIEKTVIDPVTGDLYTWDMLKKVYIT